MITTICGDIGEGKTSLATLFAIMRMGGYNALRDITRLKQYIRSHNRSLNEEVLSLPLLKNHLVYSDYNIFYRQEWQRPVRNKFIDGWNIGYANRHHKTDYLPPYSTIILDEAQMYFDCHRDSGYVPPWVVNYYAQHRHNYHPDIIMTAQRAVSIAKAIRGLCQRFIFPVKLSHKEDKYGNIIYSRWDCIEFSNTDSAEKFNDSKNNIEDGRKTSYEYWGNIFSCYNSFGYHKYFLEGRDGQNFYYGGENGLPQIEVPQGWRKYQKGA